MQDTWGLRVTAICPLSVCDGGMSLQRNAASLARGVTEDGQSEATGGRGEERKNDRTMCPFAVFLHLNTFHFKNEL